MKKIISIILIITAMITTLVGCDEKKPNKVDENVVKVVFIDQKGTKREIKQSLSGIDETATVKDLFLSNSERYYDIYFSSSNASGLASIRDLIPQNTSTYAEDIAFYTTDREYANGEYRTVDFYNVYKSVANIGGVTLKKGETYLFTIERKQITVVNDNYITVAFVNGNTVQSTVKEYLDGYSQTPSLLSVIEKNGEHFGGVKLDTTSGVKLSEIASCKAKREYTKECKIELFTTDAEHKVSDGKITVGGYTVYPTNNDVVGLTVKKGETYVINYSESEYHTIEIVIVNGKNATTYTEDITAYTSGCSLLKLLEDNYVKYSFSVDKTATPTITGIGGIVVEETATYKTTLSMYVTDAKYGSGNKLTVAGMQVYTPSKNVGEIICYGGEKYVFEANRYDKPTPPPQESESEVTSESTQESEVTSEQ